LGAEDLRAFHRRWAVPNNAVLAVYGDIDPAAVQAAVEARFGAWTSGGPGLTTATVEPSGVCCEVRHVTELREKKQGVIVIGFRGASLADDDRYPLEILQETCSDLGSRLFLRIREQLGLAYYVGAQNFTGLAAGCFSFYAGTTPADLARVEDEMMAEVALLRSEGISAEELARSKAKILGQRKISRQDLGGVAVSAALEELYGLGYDFGRTEDARYEAVTREQVVAAARKYLTPQALVVAVARPE
jgi:zinc protease